MGQGMTEGWLRADTIRRSTNMPKMPVLDIAINVEARRGEARRGEARRGDLLPATYYEQIPGRVQTCLLYISITGTRTQSIGREKGRKKEGEKRRGRGRQKTLYPLSSILCHASPPTPRPSMPDRPARTKVSTPMGQLDTYPPTYLPIQSSPVQSIPVHSNPRRIYPTKSPLRVPIHRHRHRYMSTPTRRISLGR
jgi:hypothetical protein